MIGQSLRTIKRIHLIGICGTAMASLAGMLQERGFEVTGSDHNVYPPMSTFLEKLGIPVFQGFSEPNLRAAAPDLVVVGNAISRGNAEAEATLNWKIRYASLPEVVKDLFIRGSQSIVVAGTHGKTTTTSLVAWLLEFAGLEPGFLIGGIAENFGSSYKVGAGRIFVVEGDEYDTAFFDKGSKFLHYLPDWVIFNNCEYDHADIFPDFASVKTSFRRLINIIPSAGKLFSGWDDEGVRDLSAQAYCEVISFGLGAEPYWRAEEIQHAPESTQFVALKNGKHFAQLAVPLAGNFNVKNVLAATACADSLGISPMLISEGLRGFKNVKRRLEVRGVAREVTVYDDFAHHPTAIRETLQAVRARFPAARIWAIFEPRSATSRRNIFQMELSMAFGVADQVLISNPFAPEKLDPAIRLDVDKLVSDLQCQGVSAGRAKDANAIVGQIVPRLLPGDKVVIMSNGGFDDIHQKLLRAIECRVD
jgi:UDP-N-acetylmuramate: L-alanyl-gamma-D-glutamyl-meso-diaminopimelate ligase